MPIGNLTLTSINYLGISENLLSVINLVFLRVYPHFDSLNRDLVGILFLPEIGTTGVLILSPNIPCGIAVYSMVNKIQARAIYCQ